MPEYMNVREAARLWNLTERRVSALCASGRLSGTVKMGKSWQIPVNTQPPEDMRVTTGAYRKENRDGIRPMPVGISSYRQAVQQYHVVDKTLLIRDLLNERPLVTVFSRPCKFGKSLNLDMLKTYFEKSEVDPATCFKGKNIWGCGSAYRDHMGKYPVISLSFRVWGSDSWEHISDLLKKEIQREFRRHLPKLSEGCCGADEWQSVQAICNGTAAETEYITAGRLLSRLLFLSAGERAVFLLDDYDLPMLKGEKTKAEAFLRSFLNASFQDNPNLAFAFVTGILPAYGMSLFSGVENTVINSMAQPKYSQYFGFTQAEVEELAEYYGKTDRLELCRSWYGGYRQGTEEIYNPWSVASFFQNGCIPNPYWVNPLYVLNIPVFPTETKEKLYAPLQSLLAGQAVPSFLNPYGIGPEKEWTSADVLCILLLSGYLTMAGDVEQVQGALMGKLILPNQETLVVLRAAVSQMLDNVISGEQALAIREALFTGKSDALKAAIRSIITQAAAGSNENNDAFYESLSLAFYSLLGEIYTVECTAGASGRYTMQMLPRKKENPAIILEMKAERSCTITELKRGAIALYRSIGERKLEEELKKQGIETVMSFGVGLCGKNAEVAAL